MRMTLALGAIALIFAGSAAPIAAQEASGGDRINAIIVYGDDRCPVPTGDEITICARKPERERYRIPQGLRETPSATSEAWNNRVLAYERVGRTGTLSCSPTGPGGWTGCSQKLIDTAYAEKREGEDLQFSKIIDAERAKRLATLDADSAATQARVEQAEKAYDARQRKEAGTDDDAPQMKMPALAAPLPMPAGK